MTFSQHGSMVTPTISNARSRGREDRGAADKSSAFAPAQEAGARERGCRRSGNGSCAVCRWFVGEHPPDCHVCGALSQSASCSSPQKVMTGLPDCSTVAAVNASQSIYGFVFCCKGRNISYAFVIYNKYYTQSVRIWQAINRFAKKTNILRYLIKFVMIFPQKT